MLKKFNSGDIFTSVIRAYPKVEFFVNSGSVDSVYYNREIQYSGSSVPDGHASLSNLVNTIPPPITVPFANTSFESGSWDDANFNEEQLAAILAQDFTSPSGSANTDFDSSWDGT